MDIFLIHYERRISMQSQTYRDIIDEKIEEWQQGLENLAKMLDRASADKKSLLSTRVDELKAAIDAAVVQLRDLDARETAQNTMETKERILDIFGSIDKNFAEYQEKTPFML